MFLLYAIKFWLGCFFLYAIEFWLNENFQMKIFVNAYIPLQVYS